MDGVLSANVIPMSTEGEPLRTVNIKDGYALHLAARHEIPLAIITGGRTKLCAKRFLFGIIAGEISIWVFRQDTIIATSATAIVCGMKKFYIVGDDIPDIEVMRTWFAFVRGMPLLR